MAAITASLSGFPEWLPSGRVVENHVLDALRWVFELHGFASVETRAVEPLKELLRKGETSKEVYLLSRLADLGTEGEGGADPNRLGLHFDLTVPFARYVVENSGHLHFPFRRYQIQKVWRGERPQDGRFREFTQADIDVVGDGTLAFHHEVEIPLVMAAALTKLGIGKFAIHVNNRKAAQGAYESLGISDVEGALRAIDKLAKIGPDGVKAELLGLEGVSEAAALAAIELAGIQGTENISAQAREVVERAGGTVSELMEQGLAELEELLSAATTRAPGVVIADLSVARGLDYYTGSVYETFLVGHESLGSICSGGRYDSLASDGKRTYPGVGMSIGVSRLVSRLLSADLASASRSVPSAVLVAVTDEAERSASDAVAAQLRERGIPCEVSPSAAKFGKQIRHADRRGIPFVWFPGTGEVKDIRSGEQVAADPAVWAPAPEDWWPTVVANG
ncbi:MAG: histidine--tRNA ligase [Buchananella hordeovulneris]|nr:histidine--tRNA ligase [Buchananella hordeovulneris]